MASTVTPSATAKQGHDDPQPEEQIPSIHHASDEGRIDGDHPNSCWYFKTEYYKQGESGTVAHTAAAAAEQPQGVGSPVPPHIIRGVGGVGFTMNT
ncbi:hypothetical protein BKA70DRAFT_1439414 [Coprinopsis sp. MPI-PUGE-AT-0042]|nr:hypothetical protein BKA70DRAFT_1439414 [Coprinopsis sp. MPI-PUGE-AT-0042]